MSSIPCTIGTMCVLNHGHFGWHCQFDLYDFTLQVHNCKKIQIAALTFDSHDKLPTIDPTPVFIGHKLFCYIPYTYTTIYITAQNCFVTAYYYCGGAFDTHVFLFCYERTNLRTCTYVQTYRCITLTFYPIYHIYSV